MSTESLNPARRRIAQIGTETAGQTMRQNIEGTDGVKLRQPATGADPTDLSMGGQIDIATAYNNAGPDRKLLTTYKGLLHGKLNNSAIGAKVVTFKGGDNDGKTVTNHDDTVYFSVPKSYIEEYERAEMAEAEDSDTGNEDYDEYNPKKLGFDTLSREQQENEIRLSGRASRSMLGDSPTHKMSMSTAMVAISDEERFVMRQRAIDGTLVSSSDEFEARVARQRELAKTGSVGKKTFAGLTGKADNWTRSRDAKSAK